MIEEERGVDSGGNSSDVIASLTNYQMLNMMDMDSI